MKKRRFSITQQQGASICVALAVAEATIAEAVVKSPAHSPYFEMRRKEWQILNAKLSNYQWETD